MASERRGISEAAIKGAKQGEEQATAHPGQDARTVDPSSRASENNEAPLGGAPVAFPAPSAQPTKQETDDETIRRAEVDNREEVAEDQDAEWRRAGGGAGKDAPPT
jgi:hypothetical protein